MEEVKKIIEQLKEREYTKGEIAFLSAAVFFAGVVIGMILSPKQPVAIFSHNGSHNGCNNEGEIIEQKGKKRKKGKK